MTVESDQDLVGLRRAGAVVAQTLAETASAVEPGVRTADLDDIARQIYAQHGARSAPTLQFGFPGHILVSVNDEVVHGIPGDRMLQPADVLTIDVTVELDGYIADAARTICVPPIDRSRFHLASTSRQALRAGMEQMHAGAAVSAIGRAVETHVERADLTVIRQLTGHGTGRAIWEDPMIPNFADRSQRDVLHEGLVLTVEPIITMGSEQIYEADDGWTLKTRDGALAAHWEDTFVVTDGAPLVLTN